MANNSTFDMFQISTDKIPTSHQIHTQAEFIQIADDQVRIDTVAKRPHSPHIRATQLNEFTNWLAQNSSQASESKTVTGSPQKVLRSDDTISPPAKTTKPKLRIDDPIKHPVARKTKPHFETSNYVADSQDIQKAINELKSDGRVIADAQQADDRQPLVTPKFQNFNWPEVTDQLLAYPEMASLQLTFQDALNHNCNQFVFCSSETGAGATTLLMTLARRMAAGGQKVLLVDANISNAVLAHRLGVRFQSSWLQAISQRTRLPEIYVSDLSSKISLIPFQNLSRVSWPRTILDELGTIINSIAYQFDAVLIDAGTAEQFLSETTTPQSLGQLVVYVAKQNSMPGAETSKYKARLISSTGNVIVVENFSDNSSPAQSKVG